MVLKLKWFTCNVNVKIVIMSSLMDWTPAFWFCALVQFLVIIAYQQYIRLIKIIVPYSDFVFCSALLQFLFSSILRAFRQSYDCFHRQLDSLVFVWVTLSFVPIQLYRDSMMCHYVMCVNKHFTGVFFFRCRYRRAIRAWK